jgi:hypothetical protein
MKRLITLFAASISLAGAAQTTLTCGQTTITMTGEQLSSVKFIGSDKKANAVTNYYYKLGADSITIWEEYINEGEKESVTVIRVHKKDIDRKNLPYLDLFPGSEYEKPVQRIYITCASGECIQSTAYYSWMAPGKETISTNGFYQIDGSDKTTHQNLLDKILNWLKN